MSIAAITNAMADRIAELVAEAEDELDRELTPDERESVIDAALGGIADGN